MSSIANATATNPAELRMALRAPLTSIGIRPADTVWPAPAQPMTGGQRAYQFDPRRGLGDDLPQQARLIRVNGLLRWDFEGDVLAGSMRAGGGRAGLIGSEVIDQYQFEKIEPNLVAKKIVEIDQWLTPGAWSDGSFSSLHGLRRIDAQGELGAWFSTPETLSGKRVFLLVHGTASNCEKLLKDMREAPGGNALFAALHSNYGEVLAFDHPTLSVSPMLNAIDLAARLRLPAGSAPLASLDVVCHSRGGLVMRWFCEVLADLRTKHRVIMVGSPIAGTSLAAPARIKSALDYVTNLFDLLEAGAAAVTGGFFGSLVGALLKLFNVVIGLTARSSLPDLALQLVPGLAAQQRVGNNFEIDRLRRYTGGAVHASTMLEYFAVKSNFEPKDPGWNLLGYFSKPLNRALDAGADLIFEDTNDLVVDCTSMDELSDGQRLSDDHVLDFLTNDQVHHTNYFRQQRSIDFVGKSLGVS